MSALVGRLMAALFPTTIRGVINAVGLTYLIARAEDIIGQVLGSASVAAFVTEKMNEQIAAHGINLVLRDITDRVKLVEDFDQFAANLVNLKAGTQFTSFKGIDREAFLVEVSKVLADRVNTETGSHIVQLWPVDKLRAELGTELARQFDAGADLSGGALFPLRQVQMVQAAVGKKLGFLSPSPVMVGGAVGNTFWGPPLNDEHALKRAKGRLRAEKYRRTHRQVWVSTKH